MGPPPGWPCREAASGSILRLACRCARGTGLDDGARFAQSRHRVSKAHSFERIVERQPRGYMDFAGIRRQLRLTRRFHEEVVHPLEDQAAATSVYVLRCGEARLNLQGGRVQPGLLGDLTQ